MKPVIVKVIHSELQWKRINIIISIYDGAEYIEECLDSIQAQTYENYRILLGIDGCQKSLEKIKEIRHKYHKLNVYYSKKNVGVYKMFNTLSQLVAQDEYLQFFGADDIMFPEFLNEMQKYNQPAVNRHHGVLFIKKQDFDKLGGYRAWRCAADTDMVYRIHRLNNKKVLYAPLLFKRRVHEKQLTQAKDTGYCSEYRNKLNKISKDNYEASKPKIYIKPVGTKLEKI